MPDRPSPTRTLLPMAGHTHGTRSPVTCHLRCGDACSLPVPNTTETSYFRDVAAKVLSRRSVVGTGLSVGGLWLTDARFVPNLPWGAAARKPS